MNICKSAITGILLFSFLSPSVVLAQETDAAPSREVKATIENVVERFEVEGMSQIIFEARTDDGALFRIDTSQGFTEGVRYRLSEGDRVLLQVVPNMEGEPSVYLADVIRTRALFWIALFFALLVLLIGKKRGLLALVGLAVTIAILFFFVFPQILQGTDPVLITVIGSALILLVNMPLSHGISKSTLFAFFSACAGLILAWILSKAFVSVSQLSGLASEEAVFLFWDQNGALNPHGLLLASMILGAVGVLDDIAVAQGESVNELQKANPNMPKKELFKAAMRLGRHHVASTVNTLVLAYAGAAMPLLLLFLTSSVSLFDFINTELVAEEVVRTIAGTAALTLTVPISTWFALIELSGKRNQA